MNTRSEPSVSFRKNFCACINEHIPQLRLSKDQGMEVNFVISFFSDKQLKVLMERGNLLLILTCFKGKQSNNSHKKKHQNSSNYQFHHKKKKNVHITIISSFCKPFFPSKAKQTHTTKLFIKISKLRKRVNELTFIIHIPKSA